MTAGTACPAIPSQRMAAIANHENSTAAGRNVSTPSATARSQTPRRRPVALANRTRCRVREAERRRRGDEQDDPHSDRAIRDQLVRRPRRGRRARARARSSAGRARSPPRRPGHRARLGRQRGRQLAAAGARHGQHGNRDSVRLVTEIEPAPGSPPTGLVAGYDLGPFFDEMFEAPGHPRRTTAELNERLAALMTDDGLERADPRRERVLPDPGDRLHGLRRRRREPTGSSRSTSIPRIVPAEEWAHVERGLEQRVTRAQPLPRGPLRRAADPRRRASSRRSSSSGRGTSAAR